MFPFEGVKGQEPTFPPENFHLLLILFFHFRLKFLICSWFFHFQPPPAFPSPIPLQPLCLLQHSRLLHPEEKLTIQQVSLFKTLVTDLFWGDVFWRKFCSFFVDFYLSCEGGVQLLNCIYKFRWFLIQSDPKLLLEGLQSEPAKDTPGTMIISMERVKMISKIMIKGWWIDANSQHGSPGNAVALPCLLGPHPPSQYHRRLWSPGIQSHGNGDDDYWSLLVYWLWWWQILSFSFQYRFKW